jgi:SpoVK/Ycf46/Vps4 family AAA+-type ATPase
MDEIESLASSRSMANSSEPLDTIRVVNTILTQLDRLKSIHNLLIMTTSNLVQHMDSAFIDRADLVQYVPLPSQSCVQYVLGTCIQELMKKGLLVSGREHWTVASDEMESDLLWRIAANLRVSKGMKHMSI